MPVRVAVFTDEINRQDPASALELASDWGVEAVEIRTVPSGRFPRASDEELRELGRQIEGAGLAVSGVSPGLLKTPVTDPQAREQIETLMPRACEWARRLGTDMVSCFAFRRGQESSTPTQVRDYLARMLQIALEHDCRLTLENEAGCWGGTGTEAASLIRKVPGLQLCWDPGNAVRAGASRPFPDEYTDLSDLVVHVHLKNHDPDEERWSVLDEGPVDWAGQIAALRADRYEGYLVLETHTEILPKGVGDTGDLSPLAYNARHNLNCLRQLLR